MTKNDNPTQPSKVTAAYEVQLTDTAAAAYEGFFSKARDAASDPNGTARSNLRQIDDLLENVIPADPFNKKHALVGELREIYRIHRNKVGISWTRSSDGTSALILFIYETLRKASETQESLMRLIQAGVYDHLFQKLGAGPIPILSAPNHLVH